MCLGVLYKHLLNSDRFDAVTTSLGKVFPVPALEGVDSSSMFSAVSKLSIASNPVSWLLMKTLKRTEDDALY